MKARGKAITLNKRTFDVGEYIFEVNGAKSVEQAIRHLKNLVKSVDCLIYSIEAKVEKED